MDLFSGTSGAEFSPCRTWRYRLWRVWDPKAPRVNFLLLNPGTADETSNDPLIERCRSYAARWGYGGLVVTDLFALRATDLAELMAADDPVGPDNDAVILEVAQELGAVVCAWGKEGNFRGRADHVYALLATHEIRLFCLARNRAGEPECPRNLKGSLVPQSYERGG